MLLNCWRQRTLSNDTMKFRVEITETLQKTVEIEAKDFSTAEDIARDAYYGGDCVLTSDDYVTTEFAVL